MNADAVAFAVLGYAASTESVNGVEGVTVPGRFLVPAPAGPEHSFAGPLGGADHGHEQEPVSSWPQHGGPQAHRGLRVRRARSSSGDDIPPVSPPHGPMAQTTRWRTGHAAVLTAGLLLVAGCSDDAGGAPEAAGTGTAPTTGTDVEAPGTATGTDTSPVSDTATETVTDTETVVETQTGTIDTDEPTDVEGIEAGTEPDTAEASGPPPVLVDVRVGSHAGYDRVVWEFAGEGTPGWRAEYDDSPARQGSGFAVEIPGDATLAVLLDGVAAPFEAPEGVEAYGAVGRVAAPSTEVITEVVPGGWYEGYVDGFVGVTSEQPFRVRLFEDPTRVVLDVEH